MKAKVTLEETEFKIVLTPESQFEKDLIKTAEIDSKNLTISTTFFTNHMSTNHTITITGLEKTQPVNN